MIVCKFALYLAVLNFAIGTEDECPPLPGEGLLNGRFLRLNRRTIRLKCDVGHILLGPDVIRCQQGNWTPPFLAVCLRPEDECQPAPLVENGERLGDERKTGAQIFYHCREGYFMQGNSKIVCGANRQWDRQPPRCIAKLKDPAEVALYLINQLHTKEGNTKTSDMSGRFLGPEIYDNGLDMIFMLDRSSSVDPNDLELATSFLNKLLDTFGTDNSLKTSLTRLGVVAFGDEVDVVVALDDVTVNSTQEAFRRINAIKPDGGGTAMQLALATIVIWDYRKGAKRALFLLTDGEPNIGDDGIEPEDSAKSLKDDIGMEIFTVGIGRDIGRQRLVAIASEPPANHAFFLQGFHDFKTILDLVQSPPTTAAPIPPPSPGVCGLVDVKDDIQSKPWLTAIVVNSGSPEGVTFCAGTLLCSQWVLTSGGCFPNRRNFNPNQIFLSVGIQDLTKSESGAYALEVHLSPKHQVIQDSRFRLALVKLDRALPTNSGKPVCLPINTLQTPLSHNLLTNALLEGWGTRPWNVSLSRATLEPSGTSQLSRSIPVSLMEENSCSKAIRRRLNATHHLREKLLCTGDSVASGKPSLVECAGSMGSPLVANHLGAEGWRYRLLGIQTDLHGCTQGPVVYVDPLHYLEWIEKITGDCHMHHLI